MPVKSLLALNGPGLADSPGLDGANEACLARCREAGIELDIIQSDDIDELCIALEEKAGKYDAFIINPFATSHASSALIEKYNLALGKISDLDKAISEIRLDNIFGVDNAQKQMLQGRAGKSGFVCGLGPLGYQLAIRALTDKPSTTSDATGPSHKVYIINGPNLNLLGTREPEIYGYDTLDDIEQRCRSLGKDPGLDVECLQSNHEGEIIDWIHGAINTVDAIVINPGAFTHTSIAIHDALKAYTGYKFELHISNPHLRESFRHVSYVSPAVDAVVLGLGVNGYDAVIAYLPALLEKIR